MKYRSETRRVVMKKLSRQADSKGSPLCSRIYKSLKWSLIIGEYHPGTVLSIRSVAQKMSSGAMPAREALTRLASEKLLVSSAKRSYRVAELNPKVVADQFFVRAKLEGMATRLAVPFMTKKQTAELVSLANMMVKDIRQGNNENYIVRNYNFHFLIYESSQNEELFWLIERLWALTGPYLAQAVRSQLMPDDWQILHIEIAKAIAKANATKAVKLIEKDISWGVSTFEKLADIGLV